MIEFSYIMAAVGCCLGGGILATALNLNKRKRLLKAQLNDFQEKINEVQKEKEGIISDFEDLKSIAYYDELTGLENQTKFIIELRKLLDENPESNYALLVFEISNLRQINVMYGNEEGDKVITYVADTLIDKLGNTYIYAKIKDNTYAIISSCDEDDEPTSLAELLSDILRQYSSNIVINLSFGIYKIIDKSLDIPTMIYNAELPKRTITKDSELNYAFYTDELHQKIIDDKLMGDTMNYALEHHQFTTYLQPIVNLRNHQIVAAESLVRWNHPEKGILSPFQFIPLFERNNFIIKLDHYVWADACKTIRHWMDNNIEPIPVSINISPIHFSHPGFVTKLIALTEQFRISPQYLKLEFGEIAFSETDVDRKRILEQLADAGFPICVDNFGSFNSPINILKDLPIGELKLDRRFLNNSLPTEEGLTIVRYLNAMAKELNKNVIAEGVETIEQANNLLQIGCDFAQGFFFAKPIPLREFDELRASVIKSNYTPSVVYPSFTDNNESLLP
jgi:diguanylate cyclase (GGDEF)-like protein